VDKIESYYHKETCLNSNRLRVAVDRWIMYLLYVSMHPDMQGAVLGMLTTVLDPG
jgi:hypothetical protein